MSFNFMAAATFCSDFGAQENKVCHCFLTFGLINDMQTLDQAVSAVLFLDCCYWDAAR